MMIRHLELLYGTQEETTQISIGYQNSTLAQKGIFMKNNYHMPSVIIIFFTTIKSHMSFS